MGRPRSKIRIVSLQPWDVTILTLRLLPAYMYLINCVIGGSIPPPEAEAATFGCSDGMPKGGKMLSYTDCEDMSELKPAEIAAIARYLHVPEIVAVEIRAELCLSRKGIALIERLMMRPAEEDSIHKR